MRREFQIRIVWDGGESEECYNYPTKKAANETYRDLIRQFRREHVNEENEFHAEIVEVLHQESFESFRHEGCECAKCSGVIDNEDEGESSEHGSIHTTCA